MKARTYGCVIKPWGLGIIEIMPDSITFENQNDVQAALEKLFSCKFRFISNGIIHADGTFLRGLTVLEYYKEKHKDIPTEDIVIVPHAFYGSYRNREVFGSNVKDRTYDDDIPLNPEVGETAISIWIKEHSTPEPKKEKKVKKLYRCPACGDTLTEEQYQASLEPGGNGLCSCRFSAIDENGEICFPREYTEYEVFTREEN